ncbi:Myb/SANT-like domain containing protein, partial [Trema orientale]
TKAKISPSSQVESYFIDLLHEEAKKGFQTSTLDKKTWNAIDNAIFSRDGMRYTVPKLKSKYNRLRKNYCEFSELLSEIGMG